MDRMDLINCFRDTRTRCRFGCLLELTTKAAESSVVIREDFCSDRLFPVEKMDIQVVEGTSFQVASKHIGEGRVAILNFANPHQPGGGVVNGAMAQEECLCRSSNLNDCLTSQRVWDDYYEYHRKKPDFDFSDRLIYTKGVTVFKDDSVVPQMLDVDEWFQVDVITCAAPYLAKRNYVNYDVLGVIFRSRIRNILEAAIEMEAEVLILGAFGCGAFKNPPQLVARAFREVLEENRYRGAFKRVVFAIKSSVRPGTQGECPNLKAFRMEFSGERAVPEHILREQIKLPGGVILKGQDSIDFDEWQNCNPYKGKNFSILGDSISTLQGFNPRGYNIHYTGKTMEATGVCRMGDTWWGKVIDFFGGQLLVNDAWSGSWVSRYDPFLDRFPSGCSDERTGNLHVGGVKPDVILIYLGINDWGNGVPISPKDDITVSTADTYFLIGYLQMLRKLRKNYPNAEIWCCTLNQSRISTNPKFRFPEAFGGISIREYNRSIENAALAEGCKVIDLYGTGVPYDTVDGTHPNADGMDTLAVLVARHMAGEAGGKFLDCQAAHDAPHGVCRRCGKYIGQEDTKIQLLRLKLEGREEPVEFWGNQVRAGRNRECELVLENPYVARVQAVFSRQGESWTLRDPDSTNGTYLNGARLESGREYPLKVGDTISFAKKVQAIIIE